MMTDTGLFDYSKFNINEFATAFPSDGYLRNIMMDQAGNDLMSLGQKIKRNNVPVCVACDKGNKKGVGHFVKHLCWFDFSTMRVHKQMLDMDASDGTSEDCALAIKHSLFKLGGDILLNGQCTDSGGGGVLEGLSSKLLELALCDSDYLVAACSIHALQLQLSNAVKKVIGHGGLDKRNALQMLHSVYDLQESLDMEEWRHALVHAVRWCLAFTDDTDDDHFFVVAYKNIKRLYPFEVTPVNREAKVTDTMLEKIQAPVLTRWWTVGVGANYMLTYYLPIFRVCQVICNRYKSDSKANKVASGLYSLMCDPNNVADLALIKCFNAAFIRKHLDWLQSNTDLSGVPGFQSHNMAVRFFLMREDINSMFANTFQGFGDYRVIVSNLDEEATELQRTKEELFVKESQAALEKHFPRWLSPSLLPAALLSEDDTALLVAAVMLQDWNAGMYYEHDHKFFYSHVHGRRISYRKFGMFLTNYIEPAGLANDSPCTDEAEQAAMMVINGCNLRYMDLEDVAADELLIRKHMFQTYLPLPCQTQFVEFGVKEAQHVSQTNRSEEVRSAYGIVRSAHVTDAGNSKTGTTNLMMIVNRINTAKASVDEHASWKRQDPGYCGSHDNVLRLLKRGHFKSVRVGKKKSLIDEMANTNKRINQAQQPKPQQLTAAVTGNVLFGKLTKKLHMDDLRMELLFREVAVDEIPASITDRKKMLQELEIQRLIDDEGLELSAATKIGKKQFAPLSDAEFECKD